MDDNHGILRVTVGRRVIERGFGGFNGVAIAASGLRFRCNAAFPNTTSAYLRSFSAHNMQAPAGLPLPPFPCKPFDCTCKVMADFYEVGADGGKMGWGCAPKEAQIWWITEANPCQDPGYSCYTASDYTKYNPPFPGCSKN